MTLLINNEVSYESESEYLVDRGLNFILSHFDNTQPLWPRTISTNATEGVQIPVYSKEAALEYYKAADYLDCKINGYPKYKKGLSLRIAPSFIFIDLDQAKELKTLNKQLANTLTTIQTLLDTNPTVLWSGKGYHIYIPVSGFLLEKEDIFNEIAFNPSRKFLQWSEQYLSNRKADPCHTKGLSFANCMLRVPGSINSKNNQQVRIVKEWSPTQKTPIPRINPLLHEFYIYL